MAQATRKRKKHGFHPSAAPTKGKRSTRNVHHVRNPRLQDVAAPVQSQRSAPNQDMQATCVHTERSDRIVSSSCSVLGRSQMRVCPVVNFCDQQTYQRDTVAARNRHTSARWRRARRRTHLVPAAAAGWQSWRLRQTGRRKSGSKTLKGCHCWDPRIVFWWFGAWAASNTRTLQGGCTPYFPNETVEQRSFSTWHRFRELCFCHRVQETGMQAKYVKAKCFGSSQGDQESDVSNYWQPPVQPNK